MNFHQHKISIRIVLLFFISYDVIMTSNCMSRDLPGIYKKVHPRKMTTLQSTLMIYVKKNGTRQVQIVQIRTLSTKVIVKAMFDIHMLMKPFRIRIWNGFMDVKYSTEYSNLRTKDRMNIKHSNEYSNSRAEDRRGPRTVDDRGPQRTVQDRGPQRDEDRRGPRTVECRRPRTKDLWPRTVGDRVIEFLVNFGPFWVKFWVSDVTKGVKI